MPSDDGPRPVGLVTGASRGLGAVVAGLLAAEGFDLIVTARDANGLGAAAEPWRRRGVAVLAVPGDVSDLDHRARLATEVERFGRLDLLVNNASSLGPSPLPALAALPVERFREILETNLYAPLALTQLLLPALKAGRGLVVNISSDAALGGYPGWGGYGASKAALDLVSKTLAEELRADGVSVVAVDPGDLRTAMHQAAYPGQDISDRPLPEVTVPFWAWLLGQEPSTVSGHRFRAQSDRWEAAA